MKTITRVTQFLGGSFVPFIGIGVLIMLANVALTNLIYYMTGGFKLPPEQMGETLSYELLVDIFAVVMGLIIFTRNLKIILANGVSRKTFFLANLPPIALAAAALSASGLLISLAHGLLISTSLVSGLIYGQKPLRLLVLQFAVYFLLIMLGWLIALAYYRSSPLSKWLISVVPFLLLGVLIDVSISSPESYYRILSFVLSIMGMQRFTYNPLTAALNFFIIAGAIYLFIFLLIRKTPLKV